MALGTIILIFLLILLFLFIIGSIVLWIWMLVDSIKRTYKNADEKLMWILIIVFAQIIGAIVYYFVVKKQDKKNKRSIKNGKK